MPRLFDGLPISLGGGEAAAISLAITVQARAVLLDEAFGRRIARQQGLPVTGTLGVLVAAKRHGMLTQVRPILDEMIRQGRRISPALYSHVLSSLGE